MARVTMTAIAPLGPYITGQPAANALDLTMTAADASNKQQVAFNGPKLLLMQNTHASTPYTVTITSKADNRGRSQDVTTYSLEAGDIAAFKIDNAEGWQQSDGNLYFEASNAAVKFCVLSL